MAGPEGSLQLSYTRVYMKRVILTLQLAIITLTASAWGPKGHDVVAYIAEEHLSSKARKRVEQLLDGKSMVYVANWLDNASHTDDYAHTKTWHYCNTTGVETTYADSRKADSGDVVTAVERCVERLSSGKLNDEEARIELMMLIHLVGDMHCPMHAGRAEDRGGNGFAVTFFGRKSNLHSVWDSDIVEAAHKWSYTEWQREIDRLDRKECRAICEGGPREWIEECVTHAADIYSYTEQHKAISYDYVAHYAPLVEEQLLKGGLRLASLLEAIF